jgi:hypothetical protein
MRTLTLLKVPRRIDWRVMTPNQVSIWLSHDEPTGVKVEVDVRILIQPGLDVRGGVGRQVVQDDMDVLAGVGFHGLFEEG